MISVYTRDRFFIRATFLAILFAAFGPYLMTSPGIRLEHISIYSTLVFVIVFLLFQRAKIEVNKSLFQLFLCYLLSVLWLTIRFLFTEKSGIEAISAFENIFQPLAILFIGLILLPPRLSLDDKERLLRQCINVVVVMLFINSLFIMMGQFVDTWPLTQYFTGEYGHSKADSLVRNRAFERGRPIGIFNQPFESGLAYSLALFCWLFAKKVLGKNSFIWWVLGLGVLGGGWVSGSKVFLVGLCFALIFWFILNITNATRRRQRWFAELLVIIIIIVPLGMYTLFFSNLGPAASLFKNNYFFEQPFLQVISGGRLGKIETTHLENNFLNVWDTNFIAGVGFPVNYALDSEYLLLFSYGGLVAIAFYLLLIVTLLLKSYMGIKNPHPEGILLFFIVMLMLAAALGAPVMTINRVSIILWILIILCIVIVGDENAYRHNRT